MSVIGRVTCHSCGRRVRVGSSGSVYRHPAPSDGDDCQGSYDYVRVGDPDWDFVPVSAKAEIAVPAEDAGVEWAWYVMMASAIIVGIALGWIIREYR